VSRDYIPTISLSVLVNKLADFFEEDNRCSTETVFVAAEGEDEGEAE